MKSSEKYLQDHLDRVKKEAKKEAEEQAARAREREAADKEEEGFKVMSVAC